MSGRAHPPDPPAGNSGCRGRAGSGRGGGDRGLGDRSARRRDRTRPRLSDAYFSAAQLDRAAAFNGPQRWIGLGSLAVELAVLALLALWRPRPIRRALALASRRPWLGAAAIAAALSLILAIAGLPLAAVGHERARDFGLATQSIGPWLSDQASSAGIGALLAAIGGVAALALLRRLGRRFWIGGTVLVVGYAVITTWLAPVLLAPVFNRFEPLPQGPTRAQVLRLGREAGVSIGQVYRVDASRRSTAVNAYVDGLGPEQAGGHLRQRDPRPEPG